MRIIAKSRLKHYWETPGNEGSQSYLCEWYHFCVKQSWQTPRDIKDLLRHVSFVAKNRVIFNVKGNAYRIVCAIDYQRQAMFIKFVGTHAEYDRIDALEVE
jgi:mRNA interferase HigB